MIGLWLKISGRPDGTSKGIWGIWDTHRMTKIRSGAVEDALPVMPHAPMGQKASVCVHTRRLESWADISCPELPPPQAQSSWSSVWVELHGNTSSMREWGEQGTRKLGKWKFLFWPRSGSHVLVSYVLLSQSSYTSHPCCPPSASCQCLTSVPLLPPHGCWEPSLGLLCSNWMGSQDLTDIPAPPQWHPGGWNIIGTEESASKVLSCLIFSYSSFNSHGFSVFHSTKQLTVYVVKQHLTLPAHSQ